MTNLLLDADLWASQSGGPPPAEWTGERYEFLNASAAQSSLALQSAAPASSTIAGTLDPVVLGAEGPYALVITASGSGELFREILTEGVPVEFDVEVPEGETAELIMTHDPGGSSTPYSFEITITPEEEPPVPPTEVSDPYVIRGTHRAIENGDSPQVAWVRTEAGKMDLTVFEAITVDIQRGGNKLLTIPATGSAEGQVDFTITAANIKQKLSLLGLFRLYVRADGRVIYTGLLEVLG